MIMTLLSLFISFAQAQSSKADKLVNEHLVKTQKKMEIQSQKKETDLLVEKPQDVRPVEFFKRREMFLIDQERGFRDTELLDQKEQFSNENDPVNQIEQDVQQQRKITSDPENITDEEFVQEFKKNAEKAGLKLKIDPKTLKVHPTN